MDPASRCVMMLLRLFSFPVLALLLLLQEKMLLLLLLGLLKSPLLLLLLHLIHLPFVRQQQRHRVELELPRRRGRGCPAVGR